MQADQHAHEHEHEHEHGHTARRRRDAAFSLLRMSAALRLAIVLTALAALWGGVHWALS